MAIKWADVTTQIVGGIALLAAGGIATMVGAWTLSGGPARLIWGPKIIAEVTRIGPEGPPKDGKETEYGGDQTNVPVPGSKEYNFCAISKIQLREKVFGHCELISLGQGQIWTMSTSGGAVCKVYCLKIGMQ